MSSLEQELEKAKSHKMFVCYQADIERIIRKWANGDTDNNVGRYILRQVLTQEEFGRKIGVTWNR